MIVSSKIEKIYFGAKAFLFCPLALWTLLRYEQPGQIHQFVILLLAYIAMNLLIYWLSTKSVVKGFNIMLLLSPVDAVFLYFVVSLYSGVHSQLHMPYYFLTALVSIYLPIRKIIIVAIIFSLSYIFSTITYFDKELVFLPFARAFYIWLTAGVGYLISSSMQRSEQKLLDTLDILNERTWELESSQLMLENTYETTRALSSMLDLEQLLKEVLGIADNLLRAKKCVVLLAESKKEDLFIYAELYKRKKTIYDPPVSVADFKKTDIDIPEDKLDRKTSRIRFNNESQMLELPLISHGKVMGLLQLEPLKRGGFSDKERNNFRVFANSTAIAIDNARLHMKMQELTIIDELTSLFNYRHFRNKLADEIRRADRYKQQLSVLMADVDNFKKLNDSQGHQTGNIILQEIATIIKNSVRDVDIVARYGGEEFMVILPQTSLKESGIIAERMRINVERSYFSNFQGRRDLRATISIGVAIYPDGVISPSQLLEKVDEAMYVAKNNGRNRVCVVPSTRKAAKGKPVR